MPACEGRGGLAEPPPSLHAPRDRPAHGRPIALGDCSWPPSTNGWKCLSVALCPNYHRGNGIMAAIESKMNVDDLADAALAPEDVGSDFVIVGDVRDESSVSFSRMLSHDRSPVTIIIICLAVGNTADPLMSKARSEICNLWRTLNK